MITYRAEVSAHECSRVTEWLVDTDSMRSNLKMKSEQTVTTMSRWDTNVTYWRLQALA